MSIGKKGTLYKYFFSIDVIILTIIFDILLLLGVYLEDNNHSKIYYIMYGIIFLFIIDAIIAYIFYYLDKCNINERNHIMVHGKKITSNKLYWPLSFIIFICWMPYVIMCFPGNVYYDSGTSILYFLDINRSNPNNPPLQNVIFGTTYLIGEKIGNVNIAIFLYCFIQLIAYILIVSYGINILIKKGIPHKVVVAIVLLYCLCPFFPLYAFSMGKDSNFAIGFFVFELIAFKIIDSKEKLSKNKIVVFFAVVTILGLLRNATYFILVITLIMMLFVKRKAISNRCIVLALAAVILVNVLVPKILESPPTDIGEALSVPLQQTAYYMNRYGANVTDEEKKAIDKVLPSVDFSEYSPDISDPIKVHFNNEASDEELKDYFFTWFMQFTKEPLAYIKATILGTYAYYCPTVDKSDVKVHANVGIGLSEEALSKTQIEKNESKSEEYAREIDSEFMKLPVVGLFSKIGIYSWAVMLTTIFLLFRKKWKCFVCLMPLILLLGMCILSPVNGYFRYAFNMILSVPIIITLLLFSRKILT